MNRFLCTAFIALLATGASAQHTHTAISLGQTGQSQFAAISEIVQALRSDPDTDWSQVNIAALRQHLVDMDNVTTKARVTQMRTETTVSFTVAGDADVAASIKRMTFAHARMLQPATGWNVTVTEMPDGAEMTLTPDDTGQTEQIAALGFFGILTIGAHHQQHHLMIAKGHDPH